MRSLSPALWLCVLTTLAVVVGSNAVVADENALRKEWEAVYDREILPIVQKLCVECHGDEDPEGDFDIAQFTSGKQVSKKLDRWKQVGKRMRLKEMPPEGSPQLNDEQKSAIHRWLDSSPEQDLCGTLATDETQAWYRGYVMSRRLTRTEYYNAIRDLVGIPLDAEHDIPSDGSGGEGFDTAGDSLFTSAIHVQRYLSNASWLIDEAVPETIPIGDDARSQRVREARDRLLGQLPGGDLTETDAAKSIIARFARRAWRRPVADQEVDRLLTLFESAKARGVSFIVAVREPLKAILVSANFLFVVEAESPEGGIQKLTQHQLATRLALFIWSSTPDDELLRQADDGKLETEAQVLAQTRRMLADPKARALAENFGMQWLGLTSFLSSVRPDSEIYPQYNEQLASDLYEQAVQLLADVFGENRSILELIDANHVYVNGNLAAHYGLDIPIDAPWQRLETTDRRHGGVITLGAVLMTTSYPRRTSPVLRGRWVLEEVLGGEVPPPPPDVPALDEAAAADSMTLRERLEVHRKNPECSACHNRMDPLGFGLENFDGLGRWRDTDQGLPIDSSGTLPAGDQFQGPEELKQVLLRRADEFEEHLIKKLLGFALGRELNKFDECVIDDCKKQLGSNDYRSSVIIETIVTSYPFQHRYFKSARHP
jgi:mono/diheme cytochrome c family protein